MPGYVFDPLPVFIISGDGFEDSGLWCLGLLVQRADNGTDLVTYRDKRGRRTSAYPMLQAGVTAISYAVIDKGPTETDQSIITSGALTVADVIFDTLQTGGWPADLGHGYNFAYEVNGTYLATGDRWYWVEFNFIPAASSINLKRRYRVWVREVGFS